MTTQRKYTLFILPSLLLALFLSAGCGSKEVAPIDTNTVKKELLGKTWICETMFEREVAGDAKLTLEFLDDGSVKGSGGCNNFSGKYTLDGENLTFGPMMSTKKACGPATDEQEFSFLSFLSQIKTMKVDGDELELYSEETPVPMSFSTDGGGFLW